MKGLFWMGPPMMGMPAMLAGSFIPGMRTGWGGWPAALAKGPGVVAAMRGANGSTRPSTRCLPPTNNETHNHMQKGVCLFVCLFPDRLCMGYDLGGKGRYVDDRDT